LQYISKLGHGKNVAKSSVHKIPLKVSYKRMYRIVESLIVSGGFDNGHVVIEEKLIFVVTGSLNNY